MTALEKDNIKFHDQQLALENYVEKYMPLKI